MVVTVEELIKGLQKVTNKHRTTALCLTEVPLLSIAGILDTGEDDDAVELVLEAAAESELTGIHLKETVEARCI